MKTAAAHTEVSTHASHNVVLLTDALRILQALQSKINTDRNDLSVALTSLCRSHAVPLQWIPCNIPGNEAADSLAKEGTTRKQVDRSISYREVKTIIKAKQHSEWRHEYPGYNKTNPYYLLTKREQVSVQAQERPQPPQLPPIFYCKLHIGQT